MHSIKTDDDGKLIAAPSGLQLGGQAPDSEATSLLREMFHQTLGREKVRRHWFIDFEAFDDLISACT